MNGLDSRVLLAPEDGALGPLLRLADDRLAPGVGYGAHVHRAVEVVAVVLAGSVRHAWQDGLSSGVELVAGDVAILRAGTGLTHDEIAGDDGARVLQCYLRAAAPGSPPSHEVCGGVAGWVDLGRSDVRLWVGSDPAPDGLRIDVGPDRVMVWQFDTARPPWADF